MEALEDVSGGCDIRDGLYCAECGCENIGMDADLSGFPKFFCNECGSENVIYRS